jgi:hypothetical protein
MRRLSRGSFPATCPTLHPEIQGEIPSEIWRDGWNAAPSSLNLSKQTGDWHDQAIFLLPDESTATDVVSDLKTNGVAEEALSIVARDPAAYQSLPAADLADTSDFKPAVVQGAAVGGGTGLLAGLTMAVVPRGFAVGGAALAGMALADVAFGVWVSPMIGVSVPNREIEKFETAIKKGAFLMIVEVADDEREATRQIMMGRHKEVVFGGQSEGLLSAVG